MRKLTLLMPLAVILPIVAGAQTQEDLLWKADNVASPTTVPDYQSWATPFAAPKPKQVVPQGPTPEQLAEEQKRREAEAAEAAAKAEAEREAKRIEQERLARIAAEKKAKKLASDPTAIEADLSGVTLGGIVQGPQGNSVLIQNKWTAEGAQISAPAVVSKTMRKKLDQLNGSDSLAGGMASGLLDERLSRQGTISVTLVKIASETAVFSDGHQKYTLQVSQPPL